MTTVYPIQIIAMDKTALQAIELAKLTRFDEITNSEPAKLSTSVLTSHHQILLFSSLTIEMLDDIKDELLVMNELIVLLPKEDTESEVVQKLIVVNVRVLFYEKDTLVSIALANTLNILELMFYSNNKEMEIAVDHKDIYEIIGERTITEFYQHVGKYISSTTMNTLNVPEGFSDVTGAYFVYEIHEDLPIMEVAEALEMVEKVLPEECNIVFGTRNTHDNMKYVKLTCLISREVDFKTPLQKKINEKKTYIGKALVIVDAVYKEEIYLDDINVLADKNKLDFNDIDYLYTKKYIEPKDAVQLMRMMQDKDINENRKIEAIADVVLDEHVNIDLAEEIAHMQKLDIDKIISFINLKQEGKLPLQETACPSSLKEKYPKLRLGKSADIFVIVSENEVQEENGLPVIESDALKSYEQDGLEWLVSKKLDTKEIETFIKEYQCEEVK